MGTTSEWITAVLLAAFWGSWMAWFTARRRRSANEIPAWRFQDLLLVAPVSLCFGIGAEFKWRAFQRLLVFLMVAALVGAFLVGWLYRKRSAVR
jgi:hypothetical protein